MRLSRRHVLASGLALTAGPVRALDPGRASGRYVDERLTLAPTRAVALLQDIAEGLLARPSQLRVLVSETAVEVAALYGLAFPPVRALSLTRQVKKSELLRAGISALNAMHDKAFLEVLDTVPSLKTGRPKHDKEADKVSTAKKT